MSWLRCIVKICDHNCKECHDKGTGVVGPCGTTYEFNRWYCNCPAGDRVMRERKVGVIRCRRKDCENIMCDRGSFTYGNICDDCFNELVIIGPIDIEKFFDSPKPNKGESLKANWREFCEKEFTVRD